MSQQSLDDHELAKLRKLIETLDECESCGELVTDIIDGVLYGEDGYHHAMCCTNCDRTDDAIEYGGWVRQ